MSKLIIIKIFTEGKSPEEKIEENKDDCEKGVCDEGNENE